MESSDAVWWQGQIITLGDPWWDVGYPGSQPIWTPPEIWDGNVPQDVWSLDWIYDQKALDAVAARLIAEQAARIIEEEARKARLRRRRALEKAQEAPELVAITRVIEIIRKFGPIY